MTYIDEKGNLITSRQIDEEKKKEEKKKEKKGK